MKKKNNHEIENYSWGIIQDMIEKEVNAAFKLRVDPVMPSKIFLKTIKYNYGSTRTLY